MERIIPASEIRRIGAKLSDNALSSALSRMVSDTNKALMSNAENRKVCIQYIIPTIVQNVSMIDHLEVLLYNLGDMLSDAGYSVLHSPVYRSTHYHIYVDMLVKW